jgi:trimeric autotransporter adhesin
MSAASTQMAINAAGGTGIGRIAMGVGYQGSHDAISVGYAMSVGSRAHVSFGATASSSQTSVGTSFGL